MKPAKIAVLIVAIALAIGSFGYARHRYVQKNSGGFNLPVGSHDRITFSNPIMDQSLFGDWVKEERFFAIILPAVLIVAGGVFALKK